MGIPYLTTHLRPYATSIVFSADTPSEHPNDAEAIIDGPGLAYHVFSKCLALRPQACNPMEAAPSYEEISKATLIWLDELQRRGMSIKKIFFDGYLPPSKRPTRISRLESNFRQLVAFQANHPAGIKTSGSLEALSEHKLGRVIAPLPPVPPKIGTLPIQPFAVPAVIEALADSDQYGKLTAVVPGEADTFCADLALESGGVVLTSDSDLLVHDLGPNGSVCFFQDLQFLDSDSFSTVQPQLQYLSFHPHTIAERLALRSLSSLAFQLKTHSHITFPTAKQRAKAAETSSSPDPDFQAFMHDYLPTPPAPALNPVLSTLDPRISELIHQLPPFTSLPSSEPSIIPSMFLPPLIDDSRRASAWLPSTPIRTLAYSLLTSSVPSSPPAVIEHHRRAARLAPTSILLLSAHETVAAALSLAQLYHRLEKEITPFFGEPCAVDVWRTVGLHQLIGWFRVEERNLPSVELLAGACADGEALPVGWEDVHVRAMVQGMLYSLRVVGQIVGVVRGMGDGWRALEGIQALEEVVGGLPALKEFMPRVGTGRMDGDRLRWERVVRRVVALHDGEDVGDFEKQGLEAQNGGDVMSKGEVGISRKKKKRRKRAGNGKGASDVPKTSTNMYDLLSRE